MFESRFAKVLENTLVHVKAQRDITVFEVLFLLIILTFVVLKTLKKTKRSDKIIICLVIIVIVIVSILAMVQSISFENNIQLDIERESYVVFNGKFVFDNYKKIYFNRDVYIYENGRRKQLLYIDSGNLYNTYEWEYEELAEGEHYGTVIYGEHSKIIVSWELSKTE